jgi:hypothetical protein
MKKRYAIVHEPTLLGGMEPVAYAESDHDEELLLKLYELREQHKEPELVVIDRYRNNHIIFG